MITFENWHEVRHTMSGFAQYKIINDLLKSFVEERYKDETISEPIFSKCYYDITWHLEFTKDAADIFEYSFNCLRIYLVHNHQDVENYQFFRSIDLFYKFLSLYFDIEKRQWLEEMYKHAQKSNHHKASVFLQNIDQYFEKLTIMDNMKCLTK